MTKYAFPVLAITLAAVAPATSDGQTATETILHTFSRLEGAQPNSAPVIDSAGNLYGTTSKGGLDYAGSVYRLDPSGHYSVLYSSTWGFFPAGVVLDSAGNLYGAGGGGAYGWGAIYKLDPAGNQTVLYSFHDVPDGASPNSPLVWDSAGNLYGTTSGGGIDSYCTSGCGTVFKLDPAGNETVLYRFPDYYSGFSPKGAALDSARNLYGVTVYGGKYGQGVLFKVDPTGRETILHNFTGGDDGLQPNGGLLLSDHGIYGTTVYGGKHKAGVVFRFDSSGHFSVIYDFPGGTDGGNPVSGLVRDANGNIYGGTDTGGGGPCSVGCGTVFKIDPNGQESVLHGFDEEDGWEPIGIVLDPAGNIYGATQLGGTRDGGAIFKLDPAGHEKLLFSFPNGNFGTYPASGVILDGSGYLYGTTSGGGAGGWGVVYSVSPTGAYNVLYGFNGQADGGEPTGGLIADSAGNLYGTSRAGGISENGVVFRVDPSGNETVLYSFKGAGDGAQPVGAGLAMDALGNLYGTATVGGIVGPCLSGRCGVVFKLAPDGSETVLHNFTGGADGLTPSSAPILDAQGNLYGTAFLGGAYNQGLIYKIDPAGNYAVVYDFAGGAQGANPKGSFVRDKAGNFYGPANGGDLTGCNPPYGCGVIYELDFSGNLTILHTFTGADGTGPLSVVLDPAGNLYGNTYEGGIGDGSYGSGVIFKVDKGGTFSVVYDFDCSAGTGCFPQGALLLDRAGHIYGTTYQGGARQTGLVYKITQ
jgi:uncharacterized repeat protein (TIGR03803 family)